MSAAEQATGQASRSFWERSLPGWHAACYGLLAVLAISLVLDDLSTTQRAVGLALTAGYALAYTLLGRHLLGKDDDVRGSPYLLVVVVIVTALLYLTPTGYLLLFIAFPQIWATVTTRPAVALVGLLTVGIALAVVAEGGWTRTAALQGALTGLVNLGVALLLGLWITGLTRESDRRADLIEQLQSTRAELASAHHQQGVLAERTRLAHEIHDTLAQAFTSLLMLVQAAEAAIERGDSDGARERLRLAEETARANLAESRALISELGPLDLQTASLPEAVGRLTERLGAELGIRARATVEGQPRPLPPTSEVVLLRAAQEALANVRKHAGAHSVDVRVAYDLHETTLEVVDDGRGFEPAGVDGFGLRGMRSRAHQIGGRIEVASSPGRGTTVRVRVP